MKAIERVYTALSGGVPDRVPVVPKIWVDFAARYTETPLTEILADPQKALDIVVDAGIGLGFDAVRQFHFPERRVEVDGEKVYEIDGAGRRIGEVDMKGGLATHLYDPGYYRLDDPYIIANYQFWTSREPFVKDVSDIERIAVPDRLFLRQIGWEDRQRKAMERAGWRIGLVGDCASATLAFYICLRGMTDAMFDLIEEPRMVHLAMEKGTRMAVEKGKLNIDMGIKILRLNDSVANMSVISPAHWREFVKPHMKAVCDELHRYDKDVKIYCHICGNILPIIEDLVETGLDCIAPLDPLGGFDCAEVRARVGDEIALMGGVNTLSFIESTEEAIYDEAVRCLRGAGERGGFVLGSGCVVPKGARFENVRAVVRAAAERGVYQNGQLLP